MIRSCSLVEHIDLDHVVTECELNACKSRIRDSASEVCLDYLQYINISACNEYQNKKKMQKNK